MSKVQTDIRTTSYDAAYARSVPYEGLIDDVIAQIRAEEDVDQDWIDQGVNGRDELLHFLNVSRVRTSPPSVEMDDIEFGAPEQPEEPSFYSLEYAQQHWPQNFLSIEQRLDRLNQRQVEVYWNARSFHGVSDSLKLAEEFV